MSLTAEGYRERKWGHFPTLRKALEDKKIPAYYYGFTLASDNMFDALPRLVEIAVLTSEYEDAIKETAVSMGIEKMNHDLYNLEEALMQVSNLFNEHINKVRMINNAILFLHIKKERDS